MLTVTDDDGGETTAAATVEIDFSQRTVDVAGAPPPAPREQPRVVTASTPWTT
jgi:hypothetical protein